MGALSTNSKQRWLTKRTMKATLEWQREVKLIIMASSAMAATVLWPDLDLCATCEARGLHVHHKMIRLPAPGKRVAPRCHLARQVNPFLGDPNIPMLANLFGGKPWVNGCQGMRPAMPATRNQAMPAEPKDTKPAEKKPETEKIT